MLLLLLAVAVVSTVFAVVLDGRRRELETAWQEAHDHETAARQEGQRADNKAREATARYELLHEALVVVVDKVQHELQAVPSTAAARREILEATMKVLQKSIDQSQDSSRQPERSLASGHMILGYILREQKKTKEAIEHFNQAHDLLEKLYRVDPENDKAAGNYAAVLSVQADIALDVRSAMAEAVKLYRQALALQEYSLAQRPAHAELTETAIRRSIARSHQRLGDLAWVTATRGVIESDDGRVYLDYDERYREHFDKYLDEHQRTELTARLGLPRRRAAARGGADSAATGPPSACRSVGEPARRWRSPRSVASDGTASRPGPRASRGIR